MIQISTVACLSYIVSHNCFYQLYQLWVISCSLIFNAAVSLARVLILSHLGYCSSIYANLPWIQIERLEPVHWVVACLISGFAKADRFLYCMWGDPTLAPFLQCLLYDFPFVWLCLSVWSLLPLLHRQWWPGHPFCMHWSCNVGHFPWLAQLHGTNFLCRSIFFPVSPPLHFISQYFYEGHNAVNKFKLACLKVLIINPPP